jgi:hypothetical protein
VAVKLHLREFLSAHGRKIHPPEKATQTLWRVALDPWQSRHGCYRNPRFALWQFDYAKYSTAF